jgi:hypothetical protein
MTHNHTVLLLQGRAMIHVPAGSSNDTRTNRQQLIKPSFGSRPPVVHRPTAILYSPRHIADGHRRRRQAELESLAAGGGLGVGASRHHAPLSPDHNDSRTAFVFLAPIDDPCMIGSGGYDALDTRATNLASHHHLAFRCVRGRRSHWPSWLARIAHMHANVEGFSLDTAGLLDSRSIESFFLERHSKEKECLIYDIYQAKQ